MMNIGATTSPESSISSPSPQDSNISSPPTQFEVDRFDDNEVLHEASASSSHCSPLQRGEPPSLVKLRSQRMPVVTLEPLASGDSTSSCRMSTQRPQSAYSDSSILSSDSFSLCSFTMQDNNLKLPVSLGQPSRPVSMPILPDNLPHPSPCELEEPQAGTLSPKSEQLLRGLERILMPNARYHRQHSYTSPYTTAFAAPTTTARHYSLPHQQQQTYMSPYGHHHHQQQQQHHANTKFINQHGDVSKAPQQQFFPGSHHQQYYYNKQLPCNNFTPPQSTPPTSEPPLPMPSSYATIATTTTTTSLATQQTSDVVAPPPPPPSDISPPPALVPAASSDFADTPPDPNDPATSEWESSFKSTF